MTNVAHLLPKDALPLALSIQYINGDARLNRVLRPGMAVSMVAGESIDLSINKGGCNYQLVRKPPGRDSSVSLVGNRFHATVPGLYILRLELEGSGFARELDLAVFPVAALEQLLYPVSFSQERRMRLHGIVSDPRVTRESIALALESGAATEPWKVLLNAKEGVDVRQWS